MVGTGEHDQRAGGDAFELLDLIVAKRMRRRLTTVIDSTGLEPKRRAAWRALGESHQVPVYAVVFDPPANVVRRRNRERGNPVPSKVVSAQLRAAGGARSELAAEGFAAVVSAGEEPVMVGPPMFLTGVEAAERQREAPMTLDSGLQLSRFDLGGPPATTAATLAETARAAEE